jgi:hypothetical protein
VTTFVLLLTSILTFDRPQHGAHRNCSARRSQLINANAGVDQLMTPALNGARESAALRALAGGDPHSP